MAQRGGKRPGAGRKPQGLKRVIHQTPVQIAEAKIAERLPWLVDKLLELAEGVRIEKTLRDGTTAIVYQERPDRQAAEYLIDRIMGKPTQPVSLVDVVRARAAQEGLTDEETVEAVAEAERIMKASNGTRS